MFLAAFLIEAGQERAFEGSENSVIGVGKPRNIPKTHSKALKRVEDLLLFDILQGS